MSLVSLRPDIQGIRAIAVLAVIAVHFNAAWLPAGFVGVDVFLVISGFLITCILLQKKNQPGYTFWVTLRHFYISRFKRLAPAYFLMLVRIKFSVTAGCKMPHQLEANSMINRF